ncbi:MAG: NAD(P)-dependent oxidoreductase [Pikeienuella sp.]|uniref:NAD(P)-dependent oxidoreductase n=1 Tax=Pikeienuella sp. TaxID=2831957 RepID=UPI00391B533A
MTERIGFIGLGLMGAPMAGRLIEAGFPLTVWNRSAEKAAPFAARGAAVAESPAALAAAVDIVMLNLMDAKAVEAVVFGPAGVAEGKGAAILADFGTIPPEATRDFGARLKALNGMDWVDCPVSGGAPGAAAGTLAIMAGGEAAAAERLRPVMAHLSARYTHMGGPGAGQATKLVNQIIAGCTMAVVAEAVAFAERTGVDPALLTGALAGGFADSRPFQIFAPRMAARTYDPPLGATDTMIKDLAEVERAGGALPMVSAALAAMRASSAAGDGERDIAAIVEVWRGGEARAE